MTRKLRQVTRSHREAEISQGPNSAWLCRRNNEGRRKTKWGERGGGERESANFRFFVTLSVFRVPKPILGQNADLAAPKTSFVLRSGLLDVDTQAGKDIVIVKRQN